MKPIIWTEEPPEPVEPDYSGTIEGTPFQLRVWLEGGRWEWSIRTKSHIPGVSVILVGPDGNTAAGCKRSSTAAKEAASKWLETNGFFDE